MDSTRSVSSASADPTLLGSTTGSTSTSSSAVASNAASVDQNQFLQLLVAQLQDQDPLSPMDGTQFVSQLAQFSSLQELVNIQSTLQTGFGTLTGSASTAAAGSTSSSTGTSTDSQSQTQSTQTQSTQTQQTSSTN